MTNHVKFTAVLIAVLFSFVSPCAAAMAAATSNESVDTGPSVGENPFPDRSAIWNDEYFIGSWDIKPGMEGVAKTVISGTRIEEFKITVIQVAVNRGFNNRSMLLCRVEGWVVDFTGGIAGGMSGSPVYIDGKLAGAISGHWSNTDQKTCIVTPIDGMLPAWNSSDERFEPFELVEPGTPFDATRYIFEFAYPYVPKPYECDGSDETGVECKSCKRREYEESADGNRYSDDPKASGADSRDDPALIFDSEGTVLAEFYDLAAPIEINGKTYDSIALGMKPGIAPPEIARAIPMELCAIPVVVSAKNPALSRAFAEAMNADPAYDVSVGLPLESGDSIAVPSSYLDIWRGVIPDMILESMRYPANVYSPGILEPGCVLGQRTVRGDLSSFGYGTLTYIDGNGNFLAYGHRSGRRGFTAVPVANGFVYYVPTNWQRVGKRAVCLEIVGTVYQDRGGAIGGTIGHEPAWVPVFIKSTDIDSGRTSSLNCEVADAPEVFPRGAAGVISTGIGFPAARSTEGTVDATFIVNLDDAGIFTWRTVYLADGALGAGSWELSSFLNRAFFGEGEPLKCKSVSAVSTVTEERKSFRIAEIRSLVPEEFDKLVVPETGRFSVPGSESFETVFPDIESEEIRDWKLDASEDSIGRTYFLVKLMPWHSDSCVWIPVKLALPAELRGKKLRLQVWGGGGLSSLADAGTTAIEQEKDAQRNHIDPIRSPGDRTKSDWLREFTNSPRGQHLVVELVYAGKPKDIGLGETDDLPFAGRQIELDGVVKGYETATVIVK